MCDKVVSTPPSTIKFVPECITTHEMYDKAVNKCFSYIKKTVSKSLKYNIYKQRSFSCTLHIVRLKWNKKLKSLSSKLI